MKIGLMGYGKMGKEIEQVAIQRGHTVAWKMDVNNKETLSDAELREADAIIEFTAPAAVIANIKRCFAVDVPVVVGSTGWYEKVWEIREKCEQGNHSMIYASNFSLGVNIFFAINRKLAAIMNEYSQYNPAISETHHTQKLDAPSGTAISLAVDVLKEMDRKVAWVNEPTDKKEELEITSVRKDPVPGTHQVSYDSEIDRIDITHTAYSRKGFALGAVLAAEWLKDHKGFYEIGDMFNFGA